jgi:hypothetical protein
VASAARAAAERAARDGATRFERGGAFEDDGERNTGPPDERGGPTLSSIFVRRQHERS